MRPPPHKPAYGSDARLPALSPRSVLHDTLFTNRHAGPAHDFPIRRHCNPPSLHGAVPLRPPRAAAHPPGIKRPETHEPPCISGPVYTNRNKTGNDSPESSPPRFKTILIRSDRRHTCPAPHVFLQLRPNGRQPPAKRMRLRPQCPILRSGGCPGDAAGPRSPDTADGFQTPCGRLGSPPQADDVRYGAEENEKQDTSVYRSPSVHSRRRTTRGQRHRRTTASMPNGSRLIRDTNAPSAARIRQRGRIPKRIPIAALRPYTRFRTACFARLPVPAFARQTPSDTERPLPVLFRSTLVRPPKPGARATSKAALPETKRKAVRNYRRTIVRSIPRPPKPGNPGVLEGRAAGIRTEGRPKLSTDNRPKHTPAAETRKPGRPRRPRCRNQNGRPSETIDGQSSEACPGRRNPEPGRLRRPCCRNQNGRSSGSSAGTDGAAGCP